VRLEIHFRHMSRSEGLESLATERITRAVDGFVHRQDCHVQVWLISDLNRTSHGSGAFTCEIEVRIAPKKTFFIKKESDDMVMALNDAAEKLHILLDEAGKKERGHRRDSIETSNESRDNYQAE
jgi:ribosome-associated translation inhibitor RaiA